MPIDAPKIENAEALIAVFGAWPSFHDAEIHAIRLDRNAGGATMEADLHLFEYADQVTPEGHLEQRKHTLGTLLFQGIDELELHGFNQQNALFDLALIDISDRQMERLKWEVRFDSAYGVGASFLCERIHVLKVEPYESRKTR